MYLCGPPCLQRPKKKMHLFSAWLRQYNYNSGFSHLECSNPLVACESIFILFFSKWLNQMQTPTVNGQQEKKKVLERRRPDEQFLYLFNASHLLGHNTQMHSVSNVRNLWCSWPQPDSTRFRWCNLGRKRNRIEKMIYRNVFIEKLYL